ncbi:MAG: hypothetical protein AVDCRST_MAG35-1078, partial [uncultured Quadrisphaera sp.]
EDRRDRVPGHRWPVRRGSRPGRRAARRPDVL